MPTLARELMVPHPEDIEERAPRAPSKVLDGFDGFWSATFAADGVARETVVCVSGVNVWHNYDKFATFRTVNGNTCAIVMHDEDVRGHLADDGKVIEWDDGDRWFRVVEPAQKTAREDSKTEEQAAGAPVEEVSTSSDVDRAQQDLDDDAIIDDDEGSVRPKRSSSSDAKAAPARAEEAGASECAFAAVLSRHLKSLCDALNDGASPNVEVESPRVWQELRWQPKWEGDTPPVTTLLAACVLCSWPEGVELCVRRGGDVNGLYTGPLMGQDNCLTIPKTAVPMMRVAFSARGPAQSAIVRHLLEGRVKCRTVQTLLRRFRQDMDFVTAELLSRFEGPFHREGH